MITHKQWFLPVRICNRGLFPHISDALFGVYTVRIFFKCLIINKLTDQSNQHVVTLTADAIELGY